MSKKKKSRKKKVEPIEEPIDNDYLTPLEYTTDHLIDSRIHPEVQETPLQDFTLYVLKHDVYTLLQRCPDPSQVLALSPPLLENYVAAMRAWLKELRSLAT
ncbi:MAG: hypothetical protein ACXABY_32165 [Candidatus Thorarchaeota archaeon]